MLEAHLRQAVNAVMDAAISLATSEFREWGQAMRGELDYVEGAWAAIVWAAGSLTVLAKQALISLFMPGRAEPGIVPPGRGLFAKSIPVRKVAFLAGLAYVLGALIFFAAPPFRQALQVSLSAWNHLLRATESTEQSRLRDLGKQAQARHDPEALVFVAVRIREPRESIRLVEEAVRLDPRMIWSYATVAVRRSEALEIPQWLAKLKPWDPQNALLYLIEAESIDVEFGKTGPVPFSRWADEENNPAWQKAMAAAFDSQQLDDYLDRLREIDRSVVTRYRFSDPRAVLDGEEAGLPKLAYWDSQRFARSVLLSGQNLQAEGDVKGAAAKYWAVARFGQMIEAQARTDRERWIGTSLQSMAYKQLQAFEEKIGNSTEATLFDYLAAKFDPTKGEQTLLREEGFFGHEIARRNAAVLQISSLALLFFTGLIVIASGVLITQRRRGADSAARRRLPLAAMLGLASSVGVLLSCATIYLTYRPYWYIFQHAMLTGDTSQTPDLRQFLMVTESLPDSGYRSSLINSLPVYFWTGIILLGVTGLILILLRHFGAHARLVLHEKPRAT